MSIATIGGWLAGWSESQVAGLTAVSRPLFRAAVGQGLDLGMSRNQMLQELISRGVGIRRQTFLDAARVVTGHRLAGEQAASYDLASVPTMGKVHVVEYGNSDVYVHKIDIASTRTIDGVREQISSKYFIRTNEPITVQDATVRAKQMFDAGEIDGKYEGRVFLYSQYAGVVHQVPRKAA